jgi:large subunit ribosomal protein L6
MSRVGKKPITIPSGVEVSLTDTEITVKGPKGTLKQTLHSLVKVEKQDNEIVVTMTSESDKRGPAFWGLYRSLIDNMVQGVTDGFSKQLEVNGVGYTANVSGSKLVLKVGYSHPVEFELPEGIKGEVDKNVITITGIDKQLVGEVAANIRKVRKPEPYKGKGIKYVDEVLRRKVGKTAGKGE